MQQELYLDFDCETYDYRPRLTPWLRKVVHLDKLVLNRHKLQLFLNSTEKVSQILKLTLEMVYNKFSYYMYYCYVYNKKSEK